MQFQGRPVQRKRSCVCVCVWVFNTWGESSNAMPEQRLSAKPKCACCLGVFLCAFACVLWNKLKNSFFCVMQALLRRVCSCVSLIPVVFLNVWIHQPAVTKLSLSSHIRTRRCGRLWLQAVLASPTASPARWMLHEAQPPHTYCISTNMPSDFIHSALAPVPTLTGKHAIHFSSTRSMARLF